MPAAFFAVINRAYVKGLLQCFSEPDVFALTFAKLVDEPGRKSKTVSIRAKRGRCKIIRLNRANRKSVADGYVYFAAKRERPLPVRGFDECAPRLP